MQKSEAISSLTKALIKVQSDLKPASKNAENPHFRSKFADLNSVWDSCRELLTKNGLSVIQGNSVGMDNTVIVETILAHESGEWIQSELCLPLSKSDPQGVGSAITYGRRYGLAAIVGIVADVDDDGNAASKNGAAKPESSYPPLAKGSNSKLLASDLSGPKATGAQIALLTNKATQAGSDLQTLVSQHYGGIEVENLSKTAAGKLLDLLEGK